MKFCMITTFYPPYHFGGDAIYIYRLSNELARRGHKVDVVHCRNAYRILSPNKNPSGFPNHSNVRVFTLNSKAGFFSPFLTQQTGVPFFKRKQIRRLMEENNYDVIHYHNMSLIGITALAYGNAIKLYTMHEHWLVCPMHVLWKYDREACTKRNCFTCVLHGKRPPQFWRRLGLFDRMLPHIDAFISPSRFTRKKHHELGMNYPITHIPYFLPKSEMQEMEADGSAPERSYFLFVGRLEKIKGLQNVIPLFQKHPEYDLWIAGEGNYGDVLKKQADGAPNIRFLGRLNHTELQSLYRNAVALIVPSICYEVFGIIIIEAFLMRTPVIVNNLGALPEVVQDSGGGFVYNNEEELLTAMRRLTGDREFRNELGEAGYKAYLRYWDEESHLKQYFGLIESIRNRKAESVYV